MTREQSTPADADRIESYAAERVERDRPGWHEHVYDLRGPGLLACWCGDTVTEVDAS